jgi:hypothetical protein
MCECGQCQRCHVAAQAHSTGGGKVWVGSVEKATLRFEQLEPSLTVPRSRPPPGATEMLDRRKPDRRTDRRDAHRRSWVMKLWKESHPGLNAPLVWRVTP